MKHKLLSLLVVLTLSPLVAAPAVAAIDLPADLDRIVAGIKRLNANSATSASVSTMTDVKRIFSNNAAILKEIGDANAAFKQHLNNAKSEIPSRDTKESPAFNTLMNLTKGYEEWLKYQKMDQAASEKCIKNAGNSFSTYNRCGLALLLEVKDHERIGRQKLQAAQDAWKKWQVKYGYA